MDSARLLGSEESPPQGSSGRTRRTNLGGAIEVDKLSSRGPCAKAGMRPGDFIVWIVGPDGRSRTASNVLFYSRMGGAFPLEDFAVQWYRPETQEWGELVLEGGMSLGASFALTAEAVLQKLQNTSLLVERFKYDQLLYELWRHQEWRRLLQYSTKKTTMAWCHPCFMSCSLLNWTSSPCFWMPDPFGRCCSYSATKGRVRGPGGLLQGAAMIEVGKAEGNDLAVLHGLKLVQWFTMDDPDRHLSNYMAVALLYMAQHAHDSDLGDASARANMLQTAAHMFAGDRKALAIAEQAAQRLGVDLPVSEEQPMNQVISAPFQFGQAPSRTRIAGIDFAPMQEGQFEIVVLLGRYRANGPYYWLMRDLTMVARALQRPRGRLNGITVITCHTTRNYTNAWIQNEQAIIREGLNVRVWHLSEEDYLEAEEELEDSWNFEIDGSPFVAVLTPDQNCFPAQAEDHSECDVTVALWDLLSLETEVPVTVASESSGQEVLAAAVSEVPVAFNISRE